MPLPDMLIVLGSIAATLAAGFLLFLDHLTTWAFFWLYVSVGGLCLMLLSMVLDTLLQKKRVARALLRGLLAGCFLLFLVLSGRQTLAFTEEQHVDTVPLATSLSFMPKSSQPLCTLSSEGVLERRRDYTEQSCAEWRTTVARYFSETSVFMRTNLLELWLCYLLDPCGRGQEVGLSVTKGPYRALQE